MSDKPMSKSRRDALKTMVGGLAAVPLMNLVGMAAAQAEDLPHADENSDFAKDLQYKHDATASERKKAAKPGMEPDEQVCANCMLQQPVAEGEWVPCQIFINPKVLVNSKGWCNSWTVKPSA